MLENWQSYRWLVVHEARKFMAWIRRLRPYTLDDLVTTGMAGLHRAAVTYDPARRTHFITWARPKIWSEIRDWIEPSMHQFERQYVRDADVWAANCAQVNEGTAAVDARDWWDVMIRRLGYRFADNTNAVELTKLMLAGELSQKAIGQRLGMTECAVSQHWHRVVECLRAWEAEAA